MLRLGLLTFKELEPKSDGLQPTSDGLQPTSDGLQPISDGLQPSSDGLQPTCAEECISWVSRQELQVLEHVTAEHMNSMGCVRHRPFTKPTHLQLSHKWCRLAE